MLSLQSPADSTEGHVNFGLRCLIEANTTIRLARDTAWTVPCPSHLPLPGRLETTSLPTTLANPCPEAASRRLAFSRLPLQPGKGSGGSGGHCCSGPQDLCQSLISVLRQAADVRFTNIEVSWLDSDSRTVYYSQPREVLSVGMVMATVKGISTSTQPGRA